MNAALVQETDRFQKLPQNDDAVIGYSLKIVAVRGAIGDWAAYVGNPGASDQDVARYGHKLSREAGRQLFPNVGGAYRE